MPNLFTTLLVLPAGDMGRFGSVPLGADRITALRDEFVALRRVTAFVCGVAPEALTLDDVMHVTDVVTARAALDGRALRSGFRSAEEAGDLRDAILWLLAESFAK
jgi:hypothetical protein